jgi:hypothetical protein
LRRLHPAEELAGGEHGLQSAPWTTSATSTSPANLGMTVSLSNDPTGPVAQIEVGSDLHLLPIKPVPFEWSLDPAPHRPASPVILTNVPYGAHGSRSGEECIGCLRDLTPALHARESGDMTPPL